MRWTHKHVRKIAYTLLAIICAIPTVGFWLALVGFIILEVGLRKGFFDKWTVSKKDDKVSSKIKELEAAPDKTAWVKQEAADRAGTALVDGLLYLYGPTILLIISTVFVNVGELNPAFTENLPPEMIKKTLANSSGWTVLLVSAWMISQYIGRYNKTLKKLKELADEAATKLYKALSGPLKISAYILFAIAIGGYIALGKLGVGDYSRSILLLVPTFWPLIYFASYRNAKVGRFGLKEDK